ncbi:MAG: GNAT family N-acetyltransferase [Pyrinomonadaceae bacterium]
MFAHRVNDDQELKLLEERHAEALFDLLKNDWDYFREWMPNLHDNYSLEDAGSFIRNCLDRFAHGKDFSFGIWCESILVGVISLKSVDSVNQVASLAYFLGAAYQGKGLVTTSCRVLLDYAFTELKLHRVDILCVPENAKSRAIPERLGFTEEGRFREAQWLHTRFVDLVLYGMLVNE